MQFADFFKFSSIFWKKIKNKHAKQTSFDNMKIASAKIHTLIEKNPYICKFCLKNGYLKRLSKKYIEVAETLAFSLNPFFVISQGRNLKKHNQSSFIWCFSTWIAFLATFRWLEVFELISFCELFPVVFWRYLFRPIRILIRFTTLASSGHYCWWEKDEGKKVH